ncbi:MAG: NADPH-dependent F420 reductase [Nitriliruptoraceae bacterium]
MTIASPIAIVGGTGPQGKGLAFRFALHHHDVTIGSRDPERAQQIAAELTAQLPQGSAVRGAVNAQAVEQAAVVVVAVPFDGQASTLADLPDISDKIVISCANPLTFGPSGPRPLAVAEGSAAEQVAAVTGARKVAASFHHVSASHLITTRSDAEVNNQTVLVAGDDNDAVDTTLALANAVSTIGGLHVGPLAYARELEAFTAVLIAINRRHKAHSGVRISGL